MTIKELPKEEQSFLEQMFSLALRNPKSWQFVLDNATTLKAMGFSFKMNDGSTLEEAIQKLSINSKQEQLAVSLIVSKWWATDVIANVQSWCHIENVRCEFKRTNTFLDAHLDFTLTGTREALNAVKAQIDADVERDLKSLTKEK